MSLWSFLRDMIILDWLFGDRGCHHDDNSVIPPIGGGYHGDVDDDLPWHTSDHDHLGIYGNDRSDGIGGYGGCDPSSDDFFDDDDY